MIIPPFDPFTNILPQFLIKCNVLFFGLIIKRPKWVKDDKAWRSILSSIKIELPQGFEVQ